MKRRLEATYRKVVLFVYSRFIYELFVHGNNTPAICRTPVVYVPGHGFHPAPPGRLCFKRGGQTDLVFSRACDRRGRLMGGRLISWRSHRPLTAVIHISSFVFVGCTRNRPHYQYVLFLHTYMDIKHSPRSPAGINETYVHSSASSWC